MRQRRLVLACEEVLYLCDGEGGDEAGAGLIQTHSPFASLLLTYILRYFTEGAFDPIAVVAGLIQTAIYADFGYIVSNASIDALIR
jgi:hypothetical protein